MFNVQSSMVNGQWSTVKNAIKRVQSQACLSYAECEHFRRSQCSMIQSFLYHTVDLLVLVVVALQRQQVLLRLHILARLAIDI